MDLMYVLRIHTRTRKHAVVTRREETVYLLGTSGTGVAFDTHQILGRVSAGSLLGAYVCVCILVYRCFDHISCTCA